MNSLEEIISRHDGATVKVILLFTQVDSISTKMGNSKCVDPYLQHLIRVGTVCYHKSYTVFSNQNHLKTLTDNSL